MSSHVEDGEEREKFQRNSYMGKQGHVMLNIYVMSKNRIGKEILSYFMCTLAIPAGVPAYFSIHLICLRMEGQVYKVSVWAYRCEWSAFYSSTMAGSRLTL